jgi:hypothetical protein
MKKNAAGQWVRDEPAVLGPNRAFGGYYRSADRTVRGELLRGVPLQTAEDAVVAAVQMGYRVVDAQIDRGMRVARRLRGAAERQGVGDPGQVLDATEHLVSKALLAGLQWLEEASAEPGSPIKRLLSAEYRMIGSVLGLSGDGPATPDREGRAKSHPKTDQSPRPEKHPATTPLWKVSIRHEPKSAQRAVMVCRWDIDDAPLQAERKVSFYHLDSVNASDLGGWVATLPDGRALLRIGTGKEHPAGRWRAAVCSDDGEQFGTVEIEL